MVNTVFVNKNQKPQIANEENSGFDFSANRIEPTHASVAMLVIPIVLIFIVTDLLYVIANYLLMRIYFLEIPTPFNIHIVIIPLLAVLHIVKSIFQIVSMISIVMRWVGKSYFIIDKHLIKRSGIFTVEEKIYDLDNVRSVIVQQSFLGKMLHFGDVIVETSASGGYMDKIILAGVSNPQKFEYKIRHCF